jgi:SAM-dependent methyltransferase
VRFIKRAVVGLRDAASRFKPLLLLLTVVGRVAPGLQPRVQKGLIRQVYQILNAADRDQAVMLLNYGFEPLDPASRLQLDPSDERERYGLQLYHRVAGAVDLHGKDVLEVGCGRGGGTAFLMRTLAPRSVTGVDLADRAIAFCRARYTQPGLSFRQGDAERLPFPDASFDAVVNIESSHCYPAPERFFREVVRVLRPGGSFLFADFRQPRDLEVLRQQLDRAGLAVVDEERISPDVVRALESDTGRRDAWATKVAPRALRPMLREFVGVQGSAVHRGLRSGELEYLRFVLRAPSREVTVDRGEQEAQAPQAPANVSM